MIDEEHPSDSSTEGSFEESVTEQENPGFAPDEPTDGRGYLEWKTRYPSEAYPYIRCEAIYLGFHFIIVPFLVLLIWLGFPKVWFNLTDARNVTFMRYTFAWLGGTLAGTLFSTKWLYHSVAKMIWHQDRRLWRIFTPHISGALAFAFVVLISSGLIGFFDRRAFILPSASLATGFVVGYFSDAAIAKLAEVAQTLFGETRERETAHKHKESKKLG